MNRVLIATASILLAAPAGAQAVHKVPADHATIQEAVDAAADGDTIEISKGTYEEGVVVEGKSDLLIKGKGKVVIDPPTEIGLTLDSCTNVRVEKIRVINGAPSGFLLLNSTGCELVKCRVELSSEDGIRADGGSGHLIEKCTVKDAGRHGIALGAEELTSVDGCSVVKCKLFTPGEDGIKVNGSGNTFENCLAKTPLDDGYHVDDATLSTQNEFLSCKVVKPSFDGIVLSGDDNAFRACKVIQAGDDAVTIDTGSGAIVEDCKLVKPFSDGIFAAPATVGAALSGNKVTGPKEDDGIDMEGDEAVVTDNKVSGAADNGYEIQGDNGTYTGNSSKGAKDDGFDLGGTGNTLSANTGKGSAGFDLFDTAPGANTVLDDNNFGTVFP